MQEVLFGHFYTLQTGPCAENSAGIWVPKNKDKEWPPQPVLRGAGEKHTNPNSPKMSRLSSWASEGIFKEYVLSDRDGAHVHTDILCNAPSNILSNFYGQNSCDVGVDVKPGYLSSE